MGVNKDHLDWWLAWYVWRGLILAATEMARGPKWRELSEVWPSNFKILISKDQSDFVENSRRTQFTQHIIRSWNPKNVFLRPEKGKKCTGAHRGVTSLRQMASATLITQCYAGIRGLMTFAGVHTYPNSSLESLIDWRKWLSISMHSPKLEKRQSQAQK